MFFGNLLAKVELKLAINITARNLWTLSDQKQVNFNEEKIDFIKLFSKSCILQIIQNCPCPQLKQVLST